jgi:phosphoribosyl-ATP pyrophosphohydrolase
MSYHTRHIAKGTLGALSKVREELEEAEDAEAQGCKVLVLCELADLIGAVECYLASNHPSIAVEDLRQMSGLTARAFKGGAR